MSRIHILSVPTTQYKENNAKIQNRGNMQSFTNMKSIDIDKMEYTVRHGSNSFLFVSKRIGHNV
jgi:hypothetical protein